MALRLILFSIIITVFLICPAHSYTSYNSCYPPNGVWWSQNTDPMPFTPGTYGMDTYECSGYVWVSVLGGTKRSIQVYLWETWDYLTGNPTIGCEDGVPAVYFPTQKCVTSGNFQNWDACNYEWRKNLLYCEDDLDPNLVRVYGKNSSDNQMAINVRAWLTTVSDAKIDFFNTNPPLPPDTYWYGLKGSCVYYAKRPTAGNYYCP